MGFGCSSRGCWCQGTKKCQRNHGRDSSLEEKQENAARPLWQCLLIASCLSCGERRLFHAEFIHGIHGRGHRRIPGSCQRWIPQGVRAVSLGRELINVGIKAQLIPALLGLIMAPATTQFFLMLLQESEVMKIQLKRDVVAVLSQTSTQGDIFPLVLSILLSRHSL